MTKLLNLDEEAPDEFFIFVDQLNLITKNNFNLCGQFFSGAFTSIGFSHDILEKYLSGRLRYLPDEQGKMECIALSPFFLKAINDELEHHIEEHRYKFHPIYPSRLSAIFAFGDYESCTAAAEKHGWLISEVRKFKLIDHQLNRVIKVNMERISQARMPWSGAPIVDGAVFWEEYWQGHGNSIWNLPDGASTRRLESGVIWEYLIEGAVQCLDIKAGEEAKKIGET